MPAETKSPVGPYSQQVELCGARAVPIVWTVRDSKGELLPRFIAGSPREVARKIVTTCYDAFRLEVSASYREQFDCDLKTVLACHELADSPPQALHPSAQAQRGPA